MEGYLSKWYGQEIFLSGNMVLLNFPVQGSKADVQQPGGFCFIPPGMVQYTLDMQFFHTGKIKS